MNIPFYARRMLPLEPQQLPLLCAALSLASLQISASYAMTKEPSAPDMAAPAKSFSPPFNFTSAELKDKLLRVTAIHEDNLDTQDIQTIFSVSLSPIPAAAVNRGAIIHGVKAGQSWYYDLTLVNYPGSSSFSFGWGRDRNGPFQQFPAPQGGICISQDEFTNKILKQGWKKTSTSQGLDIPIAENFEYDSEKLNLSFDTKSWCLLSLQLLTTRSK